MADALSPRSRAYVQGGGGRRYGGYGNYVANRGWLQPDQAANRGWLQPYQAEPGWQPDLSNQFSGQSGGLDLLSNMFTGGGGGGTAPSGNIPATAAGGATGVMSPQQLELLKGMMDIWRQKMQNESPEAERRAADPVGWANKMRSIPGYEWGPGGAFANR